MVKNNVNIITTPESNNIIWEIIANFFLKVLGCMKIACKPDILSL